jgi:hypothetical protein
MAEKYPYTLTVEALKQFLVKLRGAGVPKRLDWKFVQSLGFKSSNHKSFPRILHFLGLIGADGSPVEERYVALRQGEPGRKKLGRYVREAYSELFSTYPDADRREGAALQNFFVAQTGAGERAVQAMVGTFQALCSLASFEPVGAPEEAAGGAEEAEEEAAAHRSRPEAGALTINVNIHLDLPSTTDPDVYEALFSSMARHIPKLGKE